MKKQEMLKILICSLSIAGLAACSDVAFSPVPGTDGANNKAAVSVNQLDDNNDGVLSNDEIQDDDVVVNENGDLTKEHGNSSNGNAKKDGVSAVDSDEVVSEGESSDNLDNDMEGDIDDNYACGKNSDKKVLVCHVPPGNPENRHNICISKNALQAHLDEHGVDGDRDTLGECQ